MQGLRNRCVWAWLLLAPAVFAQAPFEVGGLHADLPFSAAVAQVQQLGGDCQVKVSKNSSGGIRATCALLPCTVGSAVGTCQEQHALPTKLAIAAQPVITIGLEAQTASASLERITFLIDGSVDAVATALVERYGPPVSDATQDVQQGWSHAQRRSWRRGDYNLGLMNTPKLLILTAHRPAPHSDAH